MYPLKDSGVFVQDIDSGRVGVTVGETNFAVSSGELGNFSSQVSEWHEELQKALSEKDSLLAASVQVLTKRLKEAEDRVQELEALVTSKDERIMKLVDIIIYKMGGFDGEAAVESGGGCAQEEEPRAQQPVVDSSTSSKRG